MDNAKVSFASHPGTTAADRRSYLVRFEGEHPEIVRVYPSAAVMFVCTCKTAGDDCKHVTAARATDAAKFAKEGNKPND
jgi:hypothetical protein